MFLKKYFYFIFVFITGAVIMMVEMAAFRLATPYFGASLFVWANIIGLVMIALATGYYLGGKLADWKPEEKILMFIVLFSGLFISFLPILNKFFLPYFTGTSKISPFSKSTVFSSFCFLSLLFFIPLLFLGIVSPFVIRLQNKKLETTGFTSGSVYASSTIGSIFGTFLASFCIIPFLGINKTFLISAFALILISLIGLRKKIKKPLFLILLTPILLNCPYLARRENLIYQKESFHGLIEVIKNEDLGYVLDINRSGRWSVYHPKKILTNMYFDYFTPLYFLLKKEKGLDILIIGHAGGVISRQYSHFFKDKNLKIDGVELDPEITKAAYRFFNLAEQEGLNVINEDGRIYLHKSTKKYDLIFIDAYIDNLYIPFQLSTKEFFELTNSRLKEEGILAIMTLSRQPNKEKVFRYLSQTVKSVYPHTYFFPSKSRYEHFILGSKFPLKERIATLEERTEINELKEISLDISQNFQEIEKTKTKHLLKDNLAPLELLHEFDNMTLIFEYLRKSL